MRLLSSKMQEQRDPRSEEDAALVEEEEKTTQPRC